MDIPQDRQYSSDHEWIQTLSNGKVRIGITDYAQDALGDVVYVDLPELNLAVEAAQSICEVESTKSVSDIYAPVAGTIVEVNGDLDDAPERLNSDPYSDGWICVLDVDDPTSLEGLMSASSYQELTEGK